MSTERYRFVYGERLSLKEVAGCTGLHVEEVRELFQLGLIEPLERDPTPAFSERAVFRINKILRLKNELGIDMNSMEIVLNLLDRIEELETELKLFRR